MGAVTPETGGSWQQRLYRPAGVDAMRVLAVGLVGWLHIWQQSWVGAGRFTYLSRTGGVWVDMMILLSSFCLFLPYAHARAQGAAFPGTQGFYTRRLVRLAPSVWAFTLIQLFFFILPDQGFSPSLALDLAANLTFTRGWFSKVFRYSAFNGVVWTLGVLAVFYVLFPLLARAAWRRPAAVCAMLAAGQALYTLWALRLPDGLYGLAFNRMPAFLGVWALGLAAAWAVAYWGPLLRRAGAWLAGAAGLAALWGACLLLKHSMSASPAPQRWQLAWRMPLCGLFCLALAGLCMAPPLPGRRALRFLAGITMNFYLWHQALAVWLKYRWRIPAWQGDTPPNQLGDAAWMGRYNALCWGVALAAALAGTYLVEKPAARWLKKRAARRRQPAH